MNNLRKIAWFNLKVLAVGVPLGLLIIAVSLAAGGVVVAYVGFLVLLITALITILSRLMLLVGKEPGRVNFDERDAAIEKKSQYVSHCFLFCIFIGTCWFAVPKAGFTIVAAAMVMVQLVESVATLVQYGCGGKGND